MAERRKGQSLWSDAWRRLRKNKAAMVGLVIVVFVALSALLADVLTPYKADYGQPWLRAQPPGFAHPAVLAEIRFDRGVPAAVPEDVPDRCREIMTSDGVLSYRVLEVATTKYRIKLRRGKIDQIQRVEGARTVRELVVEGDDTYVQVLDDPEAPRVQNVTLKRRGELPEGLATEARVMMVVVHEPATPAPEAVRVRIEGGVVTSIQRGGEEIDSLRLQGRDVLETRKDGQVQRLHHPLGTDLAGRDVLARVIYGGRISMMVGAIATLVSVLIGVAYGALAGYLAQTRMTVLHFLELIAAVVLAIVVSSFVVGLLRAPVGSLLGGGMWASIVTMLIGFLTFVPVLVAVPALATRAFGHGAGPFGRQITTWGEFMMRIVDILNALPFMFLVILLMVTVGREIVTLFLALGAVQWLTIARIVRGQVLSLKEKEFVEAANMCGTGHAGILFRHLIPNTLGVVIVYATLTVPAVILQESFLAFIGLNVEVDGRALDSWGSLVNIGRQALTEGGGNWWILIFPSVAMAVTLFSLNFLGDGLRDALDPKLKGKS